MNPAVLFWSSLEVLTAPRLLKLKALFGDPERAWRSFGRPLLEQLGCDPNKIEAVLALANAFDETRLVRTLDRLNVRVLFIEDEDYPLLLREIPDPPIFLFVRGILPSLHKSMAVVGTRNISAYGEFATQKLVSQLVRAGFTIVSGLAMGVDACAHQKTLEDGGSTIAVLASGVDLLTPRQNERLGHALLEKGGAILSEYPLGTQAESFHFPRRNRIISGLAQGVLVTEGGIKSGALITARFALEQGRDVFAVPGNLQQPGMAGTNHLIRRGEAKLVESVEHILDEYQMVLPVFSEPAGLALTSLEQQLLQHLARGGKTMDELATLLTFSIPQLSEILLSLQLKGSVRELGHQWVVA